MLTYIKLGRFKKYLKPLTNVKSPAHDSKGTFLFSKNQTKSLTKQPVSGLFHVRHC